MKIPHLVTKRLQLSLPKWGSEEKILAYFQQNREYLAEWEPEKPADFYSQEFWIGRIERAHKEWKKRESLRFHLYLRGTKQLIGMISCTSFERGVSQSCRIGGSIAQRFQGKGYMSEGLRMVVHFLFSELNLHRIDAGYMPRNIHSEQLLQALGFQKIGIAPKQVRINGVWEDHMLTSLINEDWKE